MYFSLIRIFISRRVNFKILIYSLINICTYRAFSFFLFCRHWVYDTLLTCSLFSVLLEEQDKLAAIAPNLSGLKEDIEIDPASGSIESQGEATVQVHFSRWFYFFKSPILRNRMLEIERNCLSDSKTNKSIETKFLFSFQVTFLPKNEITLKECPILQCHLLDTNKQTAVVAKIPLTISLISYYTR